MLAEEEATVLRASRGTIWLWHPARGMLVNRVIGVFTTQAATALERMLHRIIKEDGSCECFQDWEGMTDYEDDTRRRLTEVIQMLYAKNGVKQESHFLLGSKVVAFGVHVAGLTIKQSNLSLREYPTRESFTTALEQALGRRRSAG